MTKLDALFPPPPEVQIRAWECAWVLIEDYRDRLTRVERLQMLLTGMRAPERLGWGAIREARQTYRQTVGARV
jgi:hypothetical protein